MKNKILALLASVGLVASASAVEINENLSINGFIDASYTHQDDNDRGEAQQLGVDEIELNFLFNHGPVSGAIHIDDYIGDADSTSADNSDVEIEQAHVTYSMDNGVSFTVGKYGSALGFEREDPAGLYTYSRAYRDNITTDAGLITANGTNSLGNDFNLGNVDANVVEGLTVAYAADAFSLAVSLENDIDANIDTDNLDAEVSFAYTGIENVSLGGGYFFDNQDNNTDEVDILNLHVAVTAGKLLLAAEYVELQGQDAANGGDRDGYLLLADYDWTDKLGVALRYSSNEAGVDTDGNIANGYEDVADADTFTIAPNYALTDNLGVIVEYSDIDLGTTDADLLALEVTYTF